MKTSAKYFCSISIVTVALLLFCHESKSQITWDSARVLSRHEGGYGKFKPSIKSSIYYNGNIGFEIVRVRNNLSLVWLMNNTATKYYGISWTNNTSYKMGLFGVNAGADIDFKFLHFGAKALLETDFQQLKYYLIPEAGVSWFGTIGAYYGYKINLNKHDFTGNNQYVIGLKYNFTKDLKMEFKNGTGFE